MLLAHKTGLGDQLKVGGFGVRLFFVLSGFLIIGILHGRRAAIEGGRATPRIELLHFYENRVFRIWPAYFLTVAIAAAFHFSGRWVGLGELLSAATFTINLPLAYSWPKFPPFVGHLWSVAVEEQFYLWAGFAFLLSSRANAATICKGVMALAVVAWLAGFFYLGMRANYVGPFVNFGYMALGGLFAISPPKMFDYARAAPWALGAFLLLPLVVFTLGRETSGGQIVSGLTPLLVPLVLVGVARDQTGWLTRLLSWPPLAHMGQISYGLYLYHQLIWAPDWAVLPVPSGRLLVDSALSLAAATASWFLLEKPLLHLRDRRRSRAAERRALTTATV